MRNQDTDVASQTKSAPISVPHTDPKSGEEVTLLKKIEELLEKDQPAAALEIIRRSKLHTPWIDNAMAVCQMRLGNADVAVQVLRRLVITNSIFLKHDAPLVFKINFATALCLADNESGCLGTLNEIQQEQHPTVIRLRACLRAWNQQRSIWERLGGLFGAPPKTPLRLDFPPGELR